MKKTLFLLTSVALAASTQAATLITTGFEKNSPTNTWDVNSGLCIQGIEVTGISETANPQFKTDGAGATMMMPNVQMSNNTTGWTVTLDIAPAMYEVTITGIELQFHFVTVDGAEHPDTDAKSGVADIVLMSDGSVLETINDWAFDRNTGLASVYFKDPHKFEMGEYFQVSINPVADQCNGTYLGLETFSLIDNPIPATPEPATASLSLLGLAALMMRRRRA